MKSGYLGASAAALLVALSAQATPAFAQASAMPAPQTEAAAANDAMDIIVTARRREERLQDVPVAVTAVTGQNLAAANIFQVQDKIGRASCGERVCQYV